MSDPQDVKVVGMKCPACQTDLVMSERQGIEIDYCPRCRGIWLDRGELDKIVERSVEQTMAPGAGAAADRPQYAEDREHRSGRGQRGHGRRSWLSEILG